MDESNRPEPGQMDSPPDDFAFCNTLSNVGEFECTDNFTRCKQVMASMKMRAKQGFAEQYAVDWMQSHGGVTVTWLSHIWKSDVTSINAFKGGLSD